MGLAAFAKYIAWHGSDCAYEKKKRYWSTMDERVWREIAVGLSPTTKIFKNKSAW
jgi:hypothetical protein